MYGFDGHIVVLIKHDWNIYDIVYGVCCIFLWYTVLIG